MGTFDDPRWPQTDVFKMAMKLLLALCLITIASAKIAEHNYILSDEFIAEINRKANGKWIAGKNFPVDTPRTTFEGMMGVHPDNHLKAPPVREDNYTEEQLKAVPAEFDPRVEWPMCDSISMVWDQGGCGSCWAFGASSAMSDRVCIHSPNNDQVLVSPQEILACCSYCGFGCNGGYTSTAWTYWHQSGVVTGGLYGDTETCQPYSLEPCEHHVDGDRPDCGDESTPKCKHECQDGYPTEFTEDKTYGQAEYSVSRQVEKIQMELMTNGPTEVSFTVYEDFLNYKSGVYEHVSGHQLGGHAVRMLGWGEENGTPYWLVANSWNSDWGDMGTFKILRGHNECGIEGSVVAGMPDFDRSNISK